MGSRTPQAIPSPATTPPDEQLLGLVAEQLQHRIHDRLLTLGLEPAVDPPERSAPELELALAELAERGAESSRALLARRFGLDPLEQQLLLLGAAAEICRPLRRAIAQWPGVPGQLPTVALAEELFGDAHGPAAVRRAFAADRVLRRQALLALVDHVEADERTGCGASEYQVSDRVLRFLLGDRTLAPSLRLYARLLEPTVGFDELRMARSVPDNLRAVLGELRRRPDGRGPEDQPGPWWGTLLPEGPLLLLLTGAPGAGRFALAEAVARNAQLRVLQVDYQALAADSEGFGPYLTRLFREATLQQALVVFVACGRLAPGEDFDASGLRVLGLKLEEFDGPVALCLDKPLHFHLFPPSRRILRADLAVPPAPYRRELWQQALPVSGVKPGIDPYELAKIFNFGGGGIRELLREATNLCLLREGPAGTLGSEDLMAAGRELQSRRMGKLTRRMAPRQSLDDLILPPRVRHAILDIIHTVRYRHIVLQDWGFGEKVSSGKGMAALFSGPPGTGKSMAAGVIAHECGMNLFRVNLAMVVSKWVGETEERLSKVFEQASESHSILLFDEADALFSKRSKVKSAQDKYANLEVNHLLQEVESFEGMVILTTNLESSIDKAFLRRLNFRLFFPKPEVDDRVLIWQQLVPAKAPFSADVDWRALAEDFDFTGGFIKNSMLRAAQWAAEKEGLITQELLCRAAEAEMAETGRVIREVHQE